jgi:dCMP deaminase
MELPDYFMKVAEIVKLRSGCMRRQVGAVFVVDGRIVSTGYNQAPSGVDHCDKVGCTIIDEHCVRAIHAELNGILNATKAGQPLQNADAYVTTHPCLRCAMALRNAGVKKIWYKEPYNAILTEAEYLLCQDVMKHMQVQKVG